MDGDVDSDWEPDEAAVVDPQSYRLNTWDTTVLGNDDVMITMMMM